MLDAIRLCSNTLAVMTERWEKLGVLAEVFEMLTTEVLAMEYDISEKGTRMRRIAAETARGVSTRFGSLTDAVLNKVVIRMIEDMLTEDTPRASDNAHNNSIQGAEKVGDLSNLDHQHTDGINDANGNGSHDSLFVQYGPDQFFDWMGSMYGFPDIDKEQAMNVPSVLAGFEIV